MTATVAFSVTGRATRLGRYNRYMNQEVFAALSDALQRGEEVALVTIVSSTGSTPQRVGAKMLVYADGRTVGTIGGGCYENEAFWKAREAIKNRKPLSVSFELNDDFAQETGLVCGGQMEVFIEPLEPSPELYVFGAGHVGYFVAKMAHEVGFRVHVIDDREKFASTERFGEGIDVQVDKIPDWIAAHRLPPTSYAVIVTRGHTYDLDTLRALTASPLRYLGLIGSKAKVKRIFDSAAGGRAPPGPAEGDPCTDRARHRRDYAAGNRRQHPGRADRRETRQDRGAKRRGRHHALGWRAPKAVTRAPSDII